MISAQRLEPSCNFVPEGVHHIHLMGICGTGMAALAGMLKDIGYRVTGSDQNVYPPMSDFLSACGIPVMDGYRPENLDPPPDLVIVGNVIRAVNPEVARVSELGIPYVSMPQALGHFFLRNHLSLVVAGTHGKTTTSSMLASTLGAAGADPGFMIGGIVEAFASNYRIGQGKYFVIEGDEYDTAFFDKGSKFLHYRPDYAIITSIEFDHADIFSDLEMIKQSFARFVSLVPPQGMIIAYGEDPVVRDIVEQADCRVTTYGRNPESDWRLENFRANGMEGQFTVSCRDGESADISLPMPGLHNALNATAVLALMHTLGFELESIRRSLSVFQGVKRRQQVRGEVNSITIIDDFAHHPTAVSETVQALQMAWPERRLIVVFEPRTNSSRRAVFQDKYKEAFAHADVVIVPEHQPLDNVPPDQQFSSSRLVSDLNGKGKEAYYFADTKAIVDFLGDFSKPGDVIAVLSNGGFDNIHQRLLDKLGRNILK